MSDPGDAGLAKTERRLGWDLTVDWTSKLRDPLSTDSHLNIAVAMAQAHPQRAKELVLDWLQESMLAGLRNDWRQPEFRRLATVYKGAMGYVDGFVNVSRSQVAVMGAGLPPDYGKVVTRWESWFKTDRFVNVIAKPGAEWIVWGRVGGGKTHVVLLFGEAALKLPGWTLMTNITGVRAKDGRALPNLVFDTRMSGFLRAWAKLPPGHRTMMAPDEIEGLLGGVHMTKAKVMWGHFRWLLRKMDTCLVTIWHDPEEVTGSVKRDASGKVSWIQKEKHEEMTIEWAPNGLPIKETIAGIPALEFLEYNTKGISNFAMDINLGQLVLALGGCQNEIETKAVMLRCLEDADYYLDGYVPKDLQDQKSNRVSAENQDSLLQDLRVLAMTLQGRDGFDFTKIWQDPTTGNTRMSQAKAKVLAKHLNGELKSHVEHVRGNEATFTDAKFGFDPKAIESKLGIPSSFAYVVAERAGAKTWKGPK